MVFTNMLYYTLAVHLLAGSSSAAAVVRRTTPNTSPKFTVEYLGNVSDGKIGVRHDGGGGARMNNQNWAVWSDTNVVKTATGPSAFAGSNSVSEISSTDPTQLTDNLNGRVPVDAIPWDTSIGESSSADYIWPSQSIGVRSSSATTGWAVYTFGTRCTVYGCPKYQTLCHVSVNTTKNTLDFERTIPKYFLEGVQPSFGRFSNVYDPSDDTLVMMDPLAHLAKVPFDSAGDLSQYKYWAGGASDNYSPNVADAAQMIESYKSEPISDASHTPYACPFSTGDLFFSDFLATWVIFYQSVCGTSFMTRFSESGKVEGPWTGDTTVYKAGNGTYSGHAYPLFLSDDASTVVLSWSDKITGIPGMATLKFS